MRNAIKELKLNSNVTIAMFDRTARRINVYFKGRTGKPIRRESAKRGGWDVLHAVRIQNGLNMDEILEFDPSVYADKISFDWPRT